MNSMIFYWNYFVKKNHHRNIFFVLRNDRGLANWLRNLSIKLRSIVTGLRISRRHTKPHSCRAILYIFSRSCIACPALSRTLSRPEWNLGISRRHFNVSALPSASLCESRARCESCDTRDHPPPRKPRAFTRLPSVTIVSRAITHARSNGQPEAATA